MREDTPTARSAMRGEKRTTDRSYAGLAISCDQSMYCNSNVSKRLRKNPECVCVSYISSKCVIINLVNIIATGSG